MIQNSVIDAAHRSSVDRLLFLGSSCIYRVIARSRSKRNTCSPGRWSKTNQPHAAAKIAGIEMCWSYNRQYGTRYLAVMPNQPYGPGDLTAENSHVVSTVT